VLARAVQRLLAVALDQYQRTLRKHGVLDFSDVLQRTLTLLARMDEFSRSRFKLEARYQHVLVDEFQDTSRAQWELVERLIASWAAGRGLTAQTLEPSIFVGDRKQSIWLPRCRSGTARRSVALHRRAPSTGPVRMAITRNWVGARNPRFHQRSFEVVTRPNGRTPSIRRTTCSGDPVEARESDALRLVAATSDASQAEAIAEDCAAAGNRRHRARS
jgi:hypothetical protein